jgi:acetylornithine/succinyldiaminopimelate/putrescine aminotransferase
MNLQEIQALDAAHVMQTYGRIPVAFVRGDGTKLWDSDGNEYLDFLGGLAVVSLGHAHPAVADALAEQARTRPWVNERGSCHPDTRRR